MQIPEVPEGFGGVIGIDSESTEEANFLIHFEVSWPSLSRCRCMRERFVQVGKMVGVTVPKRVGNIRCETLR